MTVHPRALDEHAFHQAFDAYWEAHGGTESGLRAAICTYLEKADEDAAEIDRLRQALTLPDADRRQWFISDLLDRRGYFNRSDICEAFGVSVPQASLDIRKWIERNPDAATYNMSSKRYEREALNARERT